jgi:hypothetical protein
MATDPPDTDRRGLKASRPVDLDAYRFAVSQLTAEVDLKSGPGSESDIEALLTARTAETEFHPVLECAPDGKDGALTQLLSEVRQYRPNDRSSASDVSGLVRIYLLSQIDAMWWSGADSFETDEDVVGSTDLVSMEVLRRRGLLHFKYRLQARGLMGRSRDWAFRRLMPRRQPHTAGIRLTQARPELIALLNQLAQEFAASAPPGTPALWVTSATRSVEHQRHLRELGYAAMIPSAHCFGFASDVEMRWFAEFGADRILAELLLERQRSGLCNVIDEGQAWHVCINPAAVDELRRAYDALLAA